MAVTVTLSVLLRFRTAVMLRDPRDVVLSEFRMRRDYYHDEKVMTVSLDDFIWDRFQVRLRLPVGTSRHASAGNNRGRRVSPSTSHLGFARLRRTSCGFVTTNCSSRWGLEAVEVLGSTTSLCVLVYLLSQEVLISLFKETSINVVH